MAPSRNSVSPAPPPSPIPTRLYNFAPPPRPPSKPPVQLKLAQIQFLWELMCYVYPTGWNDFKRFAPVFFGCHDIEHPHHTVDMITGMLYEDDALVEASRQNTCPRIYSDLLKDLQAAWEKRFSLGNVANYSRDVLRRFPKPIKICGRPYKLVNAWPLDKDRDTQMNCLVVSFLRQHRGSFHTINKAFDVFFRSPVWKTTEGEDVYLCERQVNTFSIEPTKVQMEDGSLGIVHLGKSMPEDEPDPDLGTLHTVEVRTLDGLWISIAKTSIKTAESIAINNRQAKPDDLEVGDCFDDDDACIVFREGEIPLEGLQESFAMSDLFLIEEGKIKNIDTTSGIGCRGDSNSCYVESPPDLKSGFHPNYDVALFIDGLNLDRFLDLRKHGFRIAVFITSGSATPDLPECFKEYKAKTKDIGSHTLPGNDIRHRDKEQSSTEDDDVIIGSLDGVMSADRQIDSGESGTGEKEGQGEAKDFVVNLLAVLKQEEFDTSSNKTGEEEEIGFGALVLRSKSASVSGCLISGSGQMTPEEEN